jgi:cytochrome c oxidase subunit II
LRASNLARRARWTAFVLIALGIVLLGACTSLPNDHQTGYDSLPGMFPGPVATVQGQESANLYPIIFWIAAAIFALVEGLIVIIVLRFRRRPGDTELPAQTHGHGKLEIVWTIVPAAIVFSLFLMVLPVLNDVDANSTTPAVTVDVVGFQWQWTFTYPDLADASGKPLSFTGAGKDGPTMVLPVGQVVRIRVTGQDVIHSWYVPQFFFKKDAIPGRDNEFELTIKDPGTYGGQCAEFCGLGHSQMYFTVQAVSPADFQTWETSAIAKANATPTPAPPPPSGGTGTVLQIKTTPDAPIAFSESTLTAKAGSQVTVQYLNDSAVAHNIVFFDGPDASAPRIAGTDIQSGPGVTESVSFTAPTTPGTYFFHCDVHPDQMFGTFVVTP